MNEELLVFDAATGNLLESEKMAEQSYESSGEEDLAEDGK